MTYTTSKSNLVTQDFDKETSEALKLLKNKPPEICPSCKIEMHQWVKHILKCPGCGRVCYLDENDECKKQAASNAPLTIDTP